MIKLKKIKKIFSVLLTVTILAGIFCINSFASNSAPQKINEIVSSFNNPNGRILCVAHKGDWRNYPENSIEGINSCVSMGADIVEIDVQRTKDGQFILMEDSTLNRMCVDSTGNSVNAKVSEKTLSEIQTYRLRDNSGGVNAKITKYKVPTLVEALQVCKGHIMVLIDNAWKYSDEIQQILTQQDVNDIAIIRGVSGSEQISSYIQRNHLPVANLSGYYTGTFSLSAKSYVKKTLTAGAKIVELSSKKSYSSLFKESVLKKFKGEGRAFVSTTNKDLCGNREDIRSSWSYLASRGFSIIETDYPSDLVNYIDQVKNYKATLSNLISKAQGLNSSNYSNETAGSLKSALKAAEDVNDKGSASFEDIDQARYNLQVSIDSLKVRTADENNVSAGKIIIIILVVLILITALYLYIRKRKKKGNKPKQGEHHPHSKERIRGRKKAGEKKPSDNHHERPDNTDYFDINS